MYRSTATLVLDNNTQVNIWFDDSGSMDTTLSLTIYGKQHIKKITLAYNNDSALYDSRVKVLNFGNVATRKVHRTYYQAPARTISNKINLTFLQTGQNNYNRGIGRNDNNNNGCRGYQSTQN
jgi:hypothetical protein